MLFLMYCLLLLPFLVWILFCYVVHVLSFHSSLLTLSGTVGVTLCRRNCHVDPHKIETCFRTFPKLKLTNAPHFHLMQNRRRIRAGYSPNSFFKAIVVHKTGCAVCAIYA